MNTQPNIRLKKELVGVVISDKMEKTVVVETDRRMVHAEYDKVVNISKTYKAHDESNERKVGDVVRIRQSRPLSKTKRWVVVETVSLSTQQGVKTAAAPTSEKATTKTKAKTKRVSKSTAKRTKQ